MLHGRVSTGAGVSPPGAFCRRRKEAGISPTVQALQHHAELRVGEGPPGQARALRVDRCPLEVERAGDEGRVRARIPQADAYAADAANGATALSIVTAHYLDTVLAAAGDVQSLSAVVARQLDRTTIMETGESIPVTAPDQVLISGTLASGAVLSATSSPASKTPRRSGPPSRARRAICACRRISPSPAHAAKASRDRGVLGDGSAPGMEGVKAAGAQRQVLSANV